MKRCSACKKNKPILDFNKNKSEKDGHAHECRKCAYIRNSIYRKKNKVNLNKKTKEWRKKNKKRVKELNTAYYEKHGAELIKKQKERDKIYRVTKKLDFAYRKRKMFWTAKYRAKIKKLKFNITIEDVVFPKICPVLGFMIDYKGKRNAYNIPSLDRINSSKGYIKGNVRVISNRANFLKNNANSDELMKVAKDLKKNGV